MASVGAPWTTTYGYDNAGRLQTVLDNRLPSGQPYRYTYAAAKSWLAQIVLPGGLTTTRTPDAFGRLLSTATKRSDATVVDSFAYTYDRAGQRSLETTPETTRTFGYDQYRQLTSAVTGPEALPALALTYDFDSIGNRLATSRQSSSEALAKEDYTVNTVNQYTRIDTAASTSTPIASTSAPEYDDNGNTVRTADALQSLGAGGQTLSLTWDDENRLVSSTNGTTTTTYVYDGLGRRVEKSEYQSGSLVTTSRYVYDGWRVVEELTSTSTSNFNLARSYTRGMDISGTFEGAGGIGSMLALTAPITADGQPSTTLQSASYVYDGNGNVTALVADDGTIRASYRYDPFGQRLAATGAWADVNPYQFSSKERDAVTGFYYYGFRYYNPSTGRWLSRDPIEERGGENLYGFVRNSPVKRIDALGLMYCFDDEDDAIDVAAGEGNLLGFVAELAIAYLKEVGGAWDAQGEELFENWIFGRGDFNRRDHPGWTNYMERHPGLMLETRDFVIEKSKLLSGNTMKIDEIVNVTPLATGTGNLVGYDLLNGPNGAVGGYNVKGYFSGCPASFSGTLRYTFNDLTDPNGFFDNFYAGVARVATFGMPENHETHISWETSFTVTVTNGNVAGQGWPF